MDGTNKTISYLPRLVRCVWSPVHLNHRIFQALVIVAVLASLGDTALGALSSPLSLDDLLQKSSSVVLGHVLEGSSARTSSVVTLDVIESFVGEIEEHSVIQVRIPTEGLSIDYEANGLWFLDRSSEGGWVVVPVVAGAASDRDFSIPASKDLFPEGDVSVGVRISVGVCEGFIADPQALSEVSYRLFALFGAYIANPGVTSCFERGLDSADVAPRVFSLAGLIRSGNGGAVAQTLIEFDELAGSDVFHTVVSAIADTRFTDPSVVRSLGGLGEKGADGPPGLAFSVAYSLRAIHTREALPFLVAFLDHPAEDVRYQAVAGMASFAAYSHLPVQQKLSVPGQFVSTSAGPFADAETASHFPTTREFRKDSGGHTSFWKDWWRRRRSEIERSQ